MSGGGPMIPPSFVTLQQLKELKEKRDAEERLKREAAAAAAAREEEERRRMLEQRPRVYEEERKRQRPENRRWKKNRRPQKPRGSPPKREANCEAKAAESKTKRDGKKEKGRGGRITGMPRGPNGSEEGSEAIGAPMKREEEKSSKVAAGVKGPARVKVSGARSWQPVRVIGSPQPDTIADVDKRVSDLKAGRRDGSPAAVGAPGSDPNPDADIEKRISDLKLGAMNPNSMRRWGRGRGGGRNPGWGRGGGRRSGRWSGDGMKWVEKTRAA